MESSRNYRLVVLAILLFAFALRLAAGVWWEQRMAADGKFFFGDSYGYWSLARSLAAGEPYEFAGSRVFRAPGYPLLLAGLFLLDPDPPVIWARWLGALMGTGAVGGVICLARQMFDRRAALLAGVFAAIYPGAIGMSVFVLSEAPFCPLMLAQFIAWAAADRSVATRPFVAYSALGGVAAGLANLVRPSWLLLTPMVACLALLGGRSQRHHVWIASIMIAATALTMAPWWVRNYVVTGTFVPTTLEIGASLYDGWNPDADGGSEMQFVDEFRGRFPSDRSEAPSMVADEVKLSHAMRDAALAWARENPRRVCQLAAIKFWRVWSPLPNAEELRNPTFRVLIALGFVPLLVTGLCGAVVYRGSRMTWLCLMPALYFTALHVVFVGSIRYRQPAMLPLTVLSAAFVAGWWRRRGERRGEAKSEGRKSEK